MLLQRGPSIGENYQQLLTLLKILMKDERNVKVSSVDSNRVMVVGPEGFKFILQKTEVRHDK